MISFEAAILGIIQGLSEFFPISSSAHLLIIPYIFNWPTFQNQLIFDVALHVGSLGALIVYQWGEFKTIAKSAFNYTNNLFSAKEIRLENSNIRPLLNIIIAVIPVIVFGYFLSNLIENNLRKVEIAAVNLILFGILLFVADRGKEKKVGFFDIGYLMAAFIGVFQVLSLIPGVSRTGIVITAGLFLGLNRFDAARFSFMLAIPSIAAAGIYQFFQIFTKEVTLDSSIFITGIFFSFISSLAAIHFLLKIIKKTKYTPFVLYRILVGLLILFVIFVNKS